MRSIYNEVFRLVEAEKTNISKKAFDVLNAEGIADIVENNGVFWFESYQIGNRCSRDVYNYLMRFIKRKMGFIYLYDLNGGF